MPELRGNLNAHAVDGILMGEKHSPSTRARELAQIEATLAVAHEVRALTLAVCASTVPLGTNVADDLRAFLGLPNPERPF